MWMPDQNRRSDEINNNELSLIPAWSVVLSVTVFAAVQYFFHLANQHAGPHGILPMRMIFSYSTGTALASYVLLIGYITRDVKRRNMSAGIWMLIVMVMPGGIGAIVYFLLRQPMVTRCPSCQSEVASGVHFCPQCQFQMAPVCGQCFRGVHITDVYCVQCGHDLTGDATPSRLRIYSG